LPKIAKHSLALQMLLAHVWHAKLIFQHAILLLCNALENAATMSQDFKIATRETHFLKPFNFYKALNKLPSLY